MELRFGNCSMRNLFFAHTAYQKNNQKKGKVKIISGECETFSVNNVLEGLLW